MKLLHTADLHFSNTPDKLEESITTGNAILAYAETDRPEAIVLAGDLVDELDGRIRLDSDTARAAINFVIGCGNIAPTIILRGTKSHDRETPTLFRHLKANHPIHVSDKIEVVGLFSDLGGPAYFSTDEIDRCLASAVFTCIPALDKSTLLSQSASLGIHETNAEARVAFNDMFSAIGQVNAGIAVPRIMIGHAMITGAEFSSGQTATGEDLEYGIGDIRLGNFDYVAMGHVHKFQQFPGNIFYCGSPGRMNFGEKEEKGFLVVEFDSQSLKEVKFVPTPARRFAFFDSTWDNGGLEAILENAEQCRRTCAGADVRFRYTIPQEEKHRIDRAALDADFMSAGARRVKIECQVIPVVRQRAAGISRLTTLPEKVQRWGDVTGQDIPPLVLTIAGRIEGLDVEELIAEALLRSETADTIKDEAEPLLEATDIQTALNF